MLKKADTNYYELRYGPTEGNSYKVRFGHSSPRFAQSVWLEYSKEGFDRVKWQKVKVGGWTLENSVIVKKTVRNTYFSTIIYGGGYAGIQQQPSTIFRKSKGIHNYYI